MQKMMNLIFWVRATGILSLVQMQTLRVLQTIYLPHHQPPPPPPNPPQPPSSAPTLQFFVAQNSSQNCPTHPRYCLAVGKSMPRSSTSVMGLDDEKGRQELRPRDPSSILPLSSVIKDALDKFQHDFKAANLPEGKYIKPPPSTSKWYRVGQPCYQDKYQELNTDFAKICITPKPPGAPMGKVPLPILKELEHQARQNISTLNFTAAFAKTSSSCRSQLVKEGEDFLLKKGTSKDSQGFGPYKPFRGPHNKKRGSYRKPPYGGNSSQSSNQSFSSGRGKPNFRGSRGRFRPHHRGRGRGNPSPQ